jgi:hypothetical protein
MFFSLRFFSVLLFILSIASIAVADGLSSTMTVTISQVGNPSRFLGLSPSDVHAILGKPIYVDTNNSTCSIPDYHGDCLIHAYQLLDGGRLGFVYAQPWHVYAVVFDNAHSVKSYSLKDFFPNGAPQKQRLITCVEKSFFYTAPGDSGGNPINVVVAQWSAPENQRFTALYRLDDKDVEVYDAVSATEKVVAPHNLDNLQVEEWALIEGGSGLGDTHLGEDMDFSTIIDPYANCTKP